jgi:hypothetical protein
MSDAAPILTIYERAALAEIDAFKNPHPSVVSRLADLAALPLEKGASLLLDNALEKR